MKNSKALTAILTTILLLGILGAWTITPASANPDPKTLHVEVRDLPSITIDGLIDGDYELFDTISGDPAYDIYIAQDDHYLYVAVDITGHEVDDASGSSSIYFDWDNNGDWSRGDVAYVDQGGYVAYMTDSSSGWQGWYGDSIPTGFDFASGTYDPDGVGVGIANRVDEWRIPLTGHPDYSTQLIPGDRIRFCTDVWVESSRNIYPSIEVPDPDNPGQTVPCGPNYYWGAEYTVRRPPPKKPVGGEVFPVDKLALMMPYIVAMLVIAAGAAIIKKHKY